MTSVAKRKYYAYLVPAGRSGVTGDWKICERAVSGVPGARYRGFPSEAAARAWLAEGAHYAPRAPRERRPAAPGIYFDAGTGRGQGVEISVTDETGKDLLSAVMKRHELNPFGKHRVRNGEATNNYGELLALRYALEIARKRGVRNVFGDSRLVIEYWSRRRAKRALLPAETVRLLDEVAGLREEFERDGGSVRRISGDDNPADLGFHR